MTRSLCNSGRGKCIRISPPLNEEDTVRLDETNLDKCKRLTAVTDDYLNGKSNDGLGKMQFDELVEALVMTRDL